ncbi:hypothetical protein FACS1894205_2160 [Alphaproteobacteria bacterium]|nr:hypothetical protein FACS1894205_2160 [Alphaproteobacteria bacterium]
MREIVRISGMQQEALGAFLGFEKGRVKNIASGNIKKFKSEEINALCERLKIRREWLISDEDPMLQTSVSSHAPVLTPPVGSNNPSSSHGAHVALLGQIFDEIMEMYRQENARIGSRAAVELAAQIHNDIVAVLSGSDDPVLLEGALKMAIQRLRRDVQNAGPETRDFS